MIHFFGLSLPIPFLLFGLVIVGIAAWPIYQKWRLRQWPMLTGTVEDAWSEDYAGGRNGKVARVRMRYSFVTEGGNFGGEYKRLFDDIDDARIFATGLKGLTVNVHYDPKNPSRSGILDEDADLLQTARAPLPPEALVRTRDNPPSALARVVAFPLMIVAAAGFILATAVNIAGWLGRVILPQSLFFAMHVGIFVVFAPAILLGRSYTKRLLRFGKSSSGRDSWLSTTCKVLFVYVFLNFFSFMIMVPSGKSHGAPSPIIWRGFSGHWMLFYFFSFAIMYSVVMDSQRNGQCVNGHTMTYDSATCPVCGGAKA